MSKGLGNLKKSLAAYGGRLSLKLQEGLDARGHVATGSLRRSIKTRVVETKVGLSLQTLMLSYGNILNRNIKPTSLPNIDAILAWMDAKGIKIDRSKTKARFKTRRQLALIIAISIKKNGFASVNKYKVGWADIILAKEMQRLKSSVRKDLFNAFRKSTLNTLK